VGVGADQNQDGIQDQLQAGSVSFIDNEAPKSSSSVAAAADHEEPAQTGEVPTEAIAVDLAHDGKEDNVVVGQDLNCEGGPDALQTTLTCPPVLIEGESTAAIQADENQDGTTDAVGVGADQNRDGIQDQLQSEGAEVIDEAPKSLSSVEVPMAAIAVDLTPDGEEDALTGEESTAVLQVDRNHDDTTDAVGVGADQNQDGIQDQLQAGRVSFIENEAPKSPSSVAAAANHEDLAQTGEVLTEAIAVDLAHDGKEDNAIVGQDLNCEGGPDALQTTLTCPPVLIEGESTAAIQVDENHDGTTDAVVMDADKNPDGIQDHTQAGSAVLTDDETPKSSASVATVDDCEQPVQGGEETAETIAIDLTHDLNHYGIPDVPQVDAQAAGRSYQSQLGSRVAAGFKMREVLQSEIRPAAWGISNLAKVKSETGFQRLEIKPESWATPTPLRRSLGVVQQPSLGPRVSSSTSLPSRPGVVQQPSLGPRVSSSTPLPSSPGVVRVVPPRTSSNLASAAGLIPAGAPPGNLASAARLIPAPSLVAPAVFPPKVAGFLNQGSWQRGASQTRYLCTI